MTFQAFEHPAISALKQAMDESPSVSKVFKHKLTPPSSSVQRYSQLASDFVVGKLVAKFDPSYTLRHGITEEIFSKYEDRWEIVTKAIVRYANGYAEPTDIGEFMYASPYRSDFLLSATKVVLVNSVGKLPDLSAVSHHYIRKFQDAGGFRIDLSPIADWYTTNRERIRSTNRGAFEISPALNLSSFLEAVIQYCWIHGYQFFPIYSPQWFEFWKDFADIWHVTLVGTEEYVPITNDLDYEHKTIKSPNVLFSV